MRITMRHCVVLLVLVALANFLRAEESYAEVRKDCDKVKRWCPETTDKTQMDIKDILSQISDLIKPYNLAGISPTSNSEEHVLLANATVINVTNYTKEFPQINGPESLLFFNGTLLASAADGNIYQLDLSRKTAVQFISTCDMNGCGRPLGMRFDGGRQLFYIADSRKGLLSYSPATGKLSVVIAHGETIDGRRMLFADDVAVDAEGNVYVSDMSTKRNIDTFPYSMIEQDRTGRILKYSPSAKDVSVVADGYRFPNGLELTPDGEYLLFSECSGKQILKLKVTGADAGKVEPFSPVLPGWPDNIRSSPRGGYWVPLCFYRDGKHAFIDKFSDQPEKAIEFTNLFILGAHALNYIFDHTGNPIYGAAAKEIGSAHFLVETFGKSGAVVRLDESGNIKYILRLEEVTYFSELYEDDDHIYVGSYRNPYLVKMSRPQE